MNKSYTSIFSILIGLCLLLNGFQTGFALPSDTIDPKAIMDAVDQQPDGDRSVSRLMMKIQDKDGRERVRVVSSKSIKFKEFLEMH